MGVVKPERFDIFLTTLDPTKGAEINKIRPCVVISSNEINFNLSTIIIAPMTTSIRKYPCRVNLKFDSKEGQVAFDQMRSVDKSRLLKKLGCLDKKTQQLLTDKLIEMFKG